MKIGIGYDVHKLVSGRKLIIGGVEIPYEMGLEGHSDADVLVHAIIDSILGALGKRDIGYVFPDTDAAFKDIDSMFLLKQVVKIMKDAGYSIGNVDSVIIAQKPKMMLFIDSMRKNIANILETSVDNINVKATTTENLGFEGQGLGIGAQAVCLITK